MSEIKKPPVYLLLPAAGKGSRMGEAQNKLRMEVLGCSLLEHTLRRFLEIEAVTGIQLIVSSIDLKWVEQLLSRLSHPKLLEPCLGGEDRQSSVRLGLEVLSKQVQEKAMVLIHDAARCLIGRSEIERAIEQTSRYGATVVAVPTKDTIKQIDEDGFVVQTLARASLVQVQTPQSFWLEDILAWHRQAQAEKLKVTDDASLAEHYGARVAIVEGSYRNLKVTTPEDLCLVENLMREER